VQQILREEASRLARPAWRWREGTATADAAQVAESGGRLCGLRGFDDRGRRFEVWLRGSSWVAGGVPLDWTWRSVPSEPWLSYPSIDDLFLHGDDRIGRWLDAHGWSRDWPYNANFGGRAEVDAYEAWWMASHPFYSGNSIAIAGGWPFRWPDADDAPPEASLVLWTCWGEPFIELWRERDGTVRVIERVT